MTIWKLSKEVESQGSSMSKEEEEGEGGWCAKQGMVKTNDEGATSTPTYMESFVGFNTGRNMGTTVASDVKATWVTCHIA